MLHFSKKKYGNKNYRRRPFFLFLKRKMHSRKCTQDALLCTDRSGISTHLFLQDVSRGFVRQKSDSWFRLYHVKKCHLYVLKFVRSEISVFPLTSTLEITFKSIMSKISDQLVNNRATKVHSREYIFSKT